VKSLVASALLLVVPVAGSDTPDDAIQEFLSRLAIPAAHVTLLRGERVALQRGYGAGAVDGSPPDESSLFPVWSISKQFTASVILSLADDGLLGLNAPAREYLPEWFANEPELRVTHLLSQTSDLLGPMRFVPAGPREYVAEELPATFRLRWNPEKSRDRFEFDWSEVRSYARRR
jgi:CubicO group peptidase (beta-lactamase class C family)